MKKVILIVCLTLLAMYTLSLNVEAKESNVNKKINTHVASLAQKVMCDQYDVCSVKDFKIKKEKLFDIELNEIGYVFDVSVKNNNEKMFVIVLENEYGYNIEEYVIDQESPFVHKKLRNIYLGYGMYYELDKDYLLDSLNNKAYNYFDILNWFGISDDGELILASSVPISEPHNETLETYNYYELVEETNYLNNNFPLFSTRISELTNNKGNNCSPIAGLELLLYYDFYYNDLTPVYNVIDFSTNDYYIYDDFYNDYYGLNNWNELVDLYLDMYDKMGTNDIFGLGTPHINFHLAITEYANSKGYEVTVNDIVGDSQVFVSTNNTSFDNENAWGNYKNAIDSGKPVVIQLGGLATEYYIAIEDDNLRITEDNLIIYRYGVPYLYYDTIEYQYTAWEGLGELHTVVGYGYVEYELYEANMYNSSLVFLREDKFAVVAWGWTSVKYAYIASNSSTVSQAYSISIEPFTVPGC